MSSYSDDGIESAAGRAVANFPQEVYDKLVELYTDAFAEAERNYRENGGEGASKTKRSGRHNAYDFSKSFVDQIDDYKNGLLLLEQK